ncbi:unnamed protein product [Spirodela intermedia]|uniref:Uncharacterized protein n=2 Tax=Spirodela intermedia TaxID=51605 RepID=A0A7I8J710_SPIIN|nr:unnamed protein product [Spirodela intermedia]CAA6665212.1 unnamed protein product [Spirodela intermedia]CAA7401942.1 unnamed protein product [Spirodela intermedia]
MPGISGKGNGSSSLQGRTTYASAYSDPSKFGSGAPSGSLGMSTEDYMASGYGHKADQYSMERRHYGDHQGAYMGRDDPSVISLQSQKSETRDQYDQASLFRQQQMMKAQSLQPGPDTRQADFLAARAATIHHGHQDISSYGGRMDAEPHNMSILGIGLPPGRDYAAGKGLHGASHESNYQGSMLSQGGYSSVGAPFLDERKDDRKNVKKIENDYENVNVNGSKNGNENESENVNDNVNGKENENAS